MHFIQAFILLLIHYSDQGHTKMLCERGRAPTASYPSMWVLHVLEPCCHWWAPLALKHMMGVGLLCTACCADPAVLTLHSVPAGCQGAQTLYSAPPALCAQESGRRAGTESVLLLAGLGKAAELARQELPRATAHMATMRDRLRGGLLERLPQVWWCGVRGRRAAEGAISV